MTATRARQPRHVALFVLLAIAAYVLFYQKRRVPGEGGLNDDHPRPARRVRRFPTPEIRTNPTSLDSTRTPECNEAEATRRIRSLWHDCSEEVDRAFCYEGVTSLDILDELTSCGPDGIHGPQTCQDLISYLRCDPELEMSESSRQHHREDVQRALADLESRCPSFSEIPWFLDCERMPCVLGIPRESLPDDGSSAHESLCFDGITSVRTYTQYNSATLIPMTALPEDRSNVDLGARWEIMMPIRWKELSQFPGLFEGQDGPSFYRRQEEGG